MAYVAVTSINIQPKDIHLAVGEKYRINPVIKPAKATNKKVKFESSNKRIAMVDHTGEVAAFGEGQTEVTVVTDDGGFTDSVKVSVEDKAVVFDSVAVTGVTVSPDTVTLIEGRSEQLTETVQPANATDKTVSWSVDDDTVAMVDSEGLVEAVKEGEATVTVTTTDGGFTATSDITVNPMPLVDLSEFSSDHWPSNYVFKKSTVYLDVEDITLSADQAGRLVQTPEGFVLERIDIAVINAPDTELSFKFMAKSEVIAEFSVASGSEVAERQETDGWQSGDYLPETWINLVNLGEKPEGEGRLALSFIGYLIEPWR